MFGAVDIGGTKTLVAVFDKAGKIAEQSKFPTPKNYDDFKIELAKVVAELSTNNFLRTVVAMPGFVNRQKGIGVAFGNLEWQNVALQADCEKIFHCPVAIENDAKLAGLSEALELKAKYAEVLYITISTGIGIGLTRNGQIDQEISDGGGKVILVEHQDRLKPWEEFASGRAIVAKYGKKASEINDVKAWKAIVKDLSVGFMNLIAITTPDVIVIGGGVGSHFDKFGGFLNETLKQYQTPMLSIPPIVRAKHPEEAVIYGCYEYAKQHYEKAITN